MNDAKPESLKPVIKKINLDIMSGPTLRTPFKTLENTTVWAADKVDSLNILSVYAIHDVYKSHTPRRFTNLKDSGGDRL